jgi:hypothetical protein
LSSSFFLSSFSLLISELSFRASDRSLSLSSSSRRTRRRNSSSSLLLLFLWSLSLSFFLDLLFVFFSLSLSSLFLSLSPSFFSVSSVSVFLRFRPSLSESSEDELIERDLARCRWRKRSFEMMGFHLTAYELCRWNSQDNSTDAWFTFGVGDRDFRAGERESDRALALPGDLDRRGESGLDGIPTESSLHQYTLFGSHITCPITSN